MMPSAIMPLALWDAERRKRKRRASVLVCGLEQGAVAHELGKVCVYDDVALLDGIVANCQVKRVDFGKELESAPLTREFACFAGDGQGLAAPESRWGGIGLGMPFNGYCDEKELPAGMMELHFHVQEILSEKRLRYKSAA